MPFYMISGKFRLFGKTKSGKPQGFEPDGDSLQFKPTKPKLLDFVERTGSACRLSTIGSTQLRFEGIDALEIHFTAGKGGVTHQPMGLAKESRDHLLDNAGFKEVTFQPSSDIRVASALRDGMPGYILSRALEVHGRPVAFVFTGEPPEKDGTKIRLELPLLEKSLNYEMLVSGEAYPLFYDTLFADLRKGLAAATSGAGDKKLGVWTSDATLSGVDGTKLSALENNAVMFPKLFRRLAEFLGDGGKLPKFLEWVASKKEPVLDLDTLNFTHFDSYIEVAGNTVRMTKAPERLVFTSAKGKATWV